MKIVLDTNVIIAGLRSKSGASYQLLRLLSAGQLDFLLSIPLLLEYEAVLKRASNRAATQLSDEDIETILDMICFAGKETSIFYLWRPKLTDPQDDMVLELAVNGQADAIVTFNINDFGNEPAKLGIKLLTPGAFLHYLQQQE